MVAHFSSKALPDRLMSSLLIMIKANITALAAALSLAIINNGHPDDAVIIIIIFQWQKTNRFAIVSG